MSFCIKYIFFNYWWFLFHLFSQSLIYTFLLSFFLILTWFWLLCFSYFLFLYFTVLLDFIKNLSWILSCFKTGNISCILSWRSREFTIQVSRSLIRKKMWKLYRVLVSCRAGYALDTRFAMLGNMIAVLYIVHSIFFLVFVVYILPFQ